MVILISPCETELDLICEKKIHLPYLTVGKEHFESSYDNNEEQLKEVIYSVLLMVGVG